MPKLSPLATSSSLLLLLRHVHIVRVHLTAHTRNHSLPSKIGRLHHWRTAKTRSSDWRSIAETIHTGYCGLEAETSIAEVSHHLARELAAIGRFENVTDYSELLADFIGDFHDLRGLAASVEPALHPDQTIGYAAGQALARSLRAGADSNGIVYSSVRNPGGTCLVAFRPDLVQNVRQGGIWRMEWRGSATPTIRTPHSSVAMSAAPNARDSEPGARRHAATNPRQSGVPTNSDQP